MSKDTRETMMFDKFLSTWYDERTYLAVLREINTYTISNISQAIKGMRRFNYRDCERLLKFFSLDHLFKGIMNANITLKLAKFTDIIDPSNHLSNIASVLEKAFEVASIKLLGIEGIANESLGAEGTAIQIAYNNIIHQHLGEKSINKLSKESMIQSAREFRNSINREFPKQQKFCPFTKEEQSKFYDLHFTKSQRFIDRFKGDWIDEVFTPIIKEKNVLLVSNMEKEALDKAVHILEEHVDAFLSKPSFKLQPTSRKKIKVLINSFLKKEAELVL